jgi:DNA polymerase-1
MAAPKTKPPIYLLDSMAFIFRAYHAMQRQRPMSTRTGIPTAATYVFVNMINKLRKDFAPEYLAAIYDVGAPTHRNELAAQLKDVQKFNIKTQAFETIVHEGYKANRAETPPDLIQQQPYIRRALEAFRIPILYYEGFEADDVLGTLSCQLSALGHHVFVVSPDKDMMQLVNDGVSILNPTKDNLVLDARKVEEVLGVPPERVVDVMALRGDSIDNIPGAPGIGDKGSVELIQQFGSVEAALDHADEVKKKTYRESLQNNRENILLSKELVTIHTSVPIEYTLDAMRTQPVDNAACRELFSELEFTTLLKELAPAVDNTPITYNLKPSPEEIGALLTAARDEGEGKRDENASVAPSQTASSFEVGSHNLRGLSLAIFENPQALTEEIAAEPDPDAGEPEPPPAENMSLFGAPDPLPLSLIPLSSSPDPACRLGLAVSDHTALEVSLDTHGLREALEDPTLPKDLHDLKAVLRALEPHGVTLRGVRDDVMLLSYLVNPTHGSHTLPDVTARFTHRALTPVVKGVVAPTLLPESANAIHRLAPILREQVAKAAPIEHHIPKDDPALGGAMTLEMLYNTPGESPSSRGTASSSLTTPLLSFRSEAEGSASPSPSPSPLLSVYHTIDLPLVPVLLRMEQAGVRIDPAVLNDMSSRLSVEIDNLAQRIYADSGHTFNINSPKQLGDVLFNKMLLPKPMKYGKGKVVSTAQDVLEELAENHPIAALVIEHRQLQKLKSTYLDQLPSLADSQGRIHTTFNQVGTATGRLSSTNPNLQNIPTRTAIGREIRAAFIAAPGNLLMSADYSQIELRLMAHFSQDPLLLNAYRTGIDIHTLTASEVFGIPVDQLDKETRARAKAVNFGIVYGISPFGLAAQLNIDQKVAKTYIETYFDRYVGVRHFIDATLDQVRREQAVRTHFGRIRPIPDIQSRNPNMRGFAERTAVNTPLQGTAADLIKLAMIALDREITRRMLKSRMTLQVHDELLFDVIPAEAEEMQQLVKHEMENVAQFSVPIVADVGLGDNWRDIK